MVSMQWPSPPRHPFNKKLFRRFCVVKTLLDKARPVAGKLTPFGTLTQYGRSYRRCDSGRDHCPSRELANQIYAVAQQLIQTEPAIRINRLVGGMDKQKQIDKLQNHQPHVAIGTPGRILDMIKGYDLVPSSVRHFVVDEADMTLDMGFLETVDAIASSFPDHLQMAVFSATIPQKLEPFLRKYMDNPTTIELKPQSVIADTVENILIAAKGAIKMS